MADHTQLHGENIISLSQNSNRVAISAVIPCRNEAAHIESLVRSLCDQEEPDGGFQLIVVDGNSNDGTREILGRLAQEYPRLSVLDNPMRITPTGMNLGICHAKGKYIAIMGSHNRYAKDYLRRAVEFLTIRLDVDNVGGPIIAQGKGRIQRAIAAAFHHPFGAGGARWHNPAYEGPVDTVFGGVYRKEVFERIGLFDEEFVRNQDDEHNLRIVRGGGIVWQSPLIRSWYHPRQSLGALFRQYAQYGYWKVRVIQKHRLPASWRHIVPGGFLLSLAVLCIAGLLWPPALWTCGAVVGIYGLCSLVASLGAARRSGWDLLPILPIVFLCYHLGYGYGFLCGSLDFVILRRRARPRWIEITRQVESPASARGSSSCTKSSGS